MFSRDDLDSAAALVHRVFPGTPQYAWPLLKAETGLDLVVKHENHTPIGAFKVRGGLVYVERLRQARPEIRGLVAATRGNHGQSIAFAGARAGLRVRLFVPHGNSLEKNAAMRAFGAELVEVGRDFDEAREAAMRSVAESGDEMVPSYHKDLCLGVATYALELFTAHPDLDTVYVPIGLGSGISGVIRTRDLLGLKTEVVGVVAQGAPAYALSVAAGHAVMTNSADTFADGMACRVPDPFALDVIGTGAARLLQLAEDEIAEAVRLYYRTTHNLAEGAGAAALAGALRERERHAGRKIGVILSGGNIDAPAFAKVLAGGTPKGAQG